MTLYSLWWNDYRDYYVKTEELIGIYESRELAVMVFEKLSAGGREGPLFDETNKDSDPDPCFEIWEIELNKTL